MRFACGFFFLANIPFFMELRDITLNTDCIYLYISINLKCNFRFIKHQKIWITLFYLNKTKIELNVCSFKFFVYFLFVVDQAEGGECCRAHYDANGFRHETMWCSHYCCQDRVRGHSPLYCCSDFFMRAERSDRLDFCSSWFSASSNL